MILHQAAGVRRRPVIAVQIAPQHPQHGHLLAAMMRRMRQPPRQHPSSRARYIKKLRLPLKPTLLLSPQGLKPFPTVLRITLDELPPHLLRRQRRRAHVNSQHGAKPEVLAHALVHHLLPHAAPSPVVRSRTHRQILIAKLAPHADNLHALGLVCLYQEVVSHGEAPTNLSSLPSKRGSIKPSRFFCAKKRAGNLCLPYHHFAYFFALRLFLSSPRPSVYFLQLRLTIFRFVTVKWPCSLGLSCVLSLAFSLALCIFSWSTVPVTRTV